jgi:hypothetical protein
VTTVDQPTVRLPLPAFTIAPDELLAQRRKGETYRLRRRDLELAAQPGALPRDKAREIAARMDAWPDKWPEERAAVLELMRRHGLTAPQILDEQRRAAITRKP